MTDEQTTPTDGDIVELLAQAREFLEEREGESALELLNDEPDRTCGPEAELVRAEAQIQMAEDFDEVLETLERAARVKAEPAKVAELYRRIRMADINLMKQSFLLSWIVDNLDDTELAVSLAKLQMRRGQPGRAEVAANRALEIDPGMPEAHRALYIAILSSDTPERAIGAIREALVVSRRNPRYPALMSTLAGMEPAEADALKVELTDHWPDSLGRQLRAGDLDIEMGKEFKPESEGVYRMALEGDLQGALAKAEAMIEAKQGMNLSAKDLTMLDLVKQLPAPDERKRSLVVDEYAEVTVSEPSQNGVTVLFFSDLTHRLNYDFELIDAFAAVEGAATMFVRDHSFRLFIGGIASLAPDRDGTIAAIREQLIALNTERLLVVGLSSGGFSALSYGRELGAKHILGLSVASSIGRFLRGEDRRARMLIARLNRSFKPEELDLNAVLPTIENEAPIDLYFGADNETDKGHSGDLAGLAGVTLHPIKGHTRHQVLPELIRDGTFQAFLKT